MKHAVGGSLTDEQLRWAAGMNLPVVWQGREISIGDRFGDCIVVYPMLGTLRVVRVLELQASPALRAYIERRKAVKR